jgi:hypothetical protein
MRQGRHVEPPGLPNPTPDVCGTGLQERERGSLTLRKVRRIAVRSYFAPGCQDKAGSSGHADAARLSAEVLTFLKNPCQRPTQSGAHRCPCVRAAKLRGRPNLFSASRQLLKRATPMLIAIGGLSGTGKYLGVQLRSAAP